MAKAMLYPNRKALFSHCMVGAPDEGMILEFGVAEGASTRQLAAMTPRPIHGFDSFEGLPEDWAGTEEKRGKFSTGGRLPQVPSSVSLHPGWFEDTIPKFKAAHPGPVACSMWIATCTRPPAPCCGLWPTACGRGRS